MIYTIYDLKIKRIEIESIYLPKSFHNKKIAFVADIHSGLFVKEKYIRKMSDMIMNEKPDIIAFGGDYIYSAMSWTHYYNYKNLYRFINGIKSLNAPLGKYAVMGNHDNLEAKHEISNALYDSGFQMLDNDIKRIEVNGEHISIGGIGDYYTDEVHLDKATSGVQENDFHILLTHTPFRAIVKAEKENYLKLIKLILAGHTHGRQISFMPMSMIEKLNKNRVHYPFDMHYGMMNYMGTKLYVTSGVGFVLVPLRVFAQPEIVMITLKQEVK